jgi:hypothetical protein
MNEQLGPLAALTGTWEGEKGFDVAPSDDRGTEHNKFRERMTFEVIHPVDNHEQKLFGLRYSTMAWRIGEDMPFHEEVGYFLWDGNAKHVMKCFCVPRGINVLAGGATEPNAKILELSAELGSPTYGITSNKFLDEEFQTVGFKVKFTIRDDNTISYEEDTVIKIKGQAELFHHTDKNTLKRVK